MKFLTDKELAALSEKELKSILDEVTKECNKAYKTFGGWHNVDYLESLDYFLTVKDFWFPKHIALVVAAAEPEKINKD